MSAGVSPFSNSRGFIGSVTFNGYFDGEGKCHPIPPEGTSASSSSRESFGAPLELSGGTHESINNFGNLKISDLQVSTCTSSHGTITATKCQGAVAEAFNAIILNECEIMSVTSSHGTITATKSKGELTEANGNIFLTDCFYSFASSSHGAIQWENSTRSDASEIIKINAWGDVTLSNLKTSNRVKSSHASVQAIDCDLESIEAFHEINLTKTFALEIISHHGTVTIKNDSFTRFPFNKISASGDITVTCVRAKEVHSFHASIIATNSELTLIHAVAKSVFTNTKVETLKLLLSKDLQGTITLSEGSSIQTLVVCQPQQQQQQRRSSSCIPAFLCTPEYGAKQGDSFFKMGAMSIGYGVEGGVGTIDGVRCIFTQEKYIRLENYIKQEPKAEIVIKGAIEGTITIQNENGTPFAGTVEWE